MSYGFKVAGKEVLQSKNIRGRSSNKKIDLPILIQDGESTSVRMLGINSHLGDKLTAFAPNTFGVTYDSGKYLSMLKQLYDIDLLIDVATNLPLVSETFKTSAQKEIDYLFSEKPENLLNKLSKLPGGVLYYLKRAYDLTK